MKFPYDWFLLRYPDVYEKNYMLTHLLHDYHTHFLFFSYQAGQGLNLGLGDAEQLAANVTRALSTGQDMGSTEVHTHSNIPPPSYF